MCWSPRTEAQGRHTPFSKEKFVSNEGYREPINELSAETRDMHRAIVSLMEELEAVDW